MDGLFASGMCNMRSWKRDEHAYGKWCNDVYGM